MASCWERKKLLMFMPSLVMGMASSPLATQDLDCVNMVPLEE